MQFRLYHLVVASGFGAIAMLAGARLLSAPTRQVSPEEHSPLAAPITYATALPRRPVFDFTVSDLINRYNAVVGKGVRQMLLPPAEAFENTGSNGVFYLLRHSVAPNVSVAVEVESATGKPFSFGMLGVSDSTTEGALRMMVAWSAIGRAVFGESEEAGALMRTCSKALEGPKQTVETQVRGFNVYCAATNGLWIGGISMPKG